jgi:hypothetical protein
MVKTDLGHISVRGFHDGITEKLVNFLALDTKSSLTAWVMKKMQFSIPDYMLVPILSLFAPTEIVHRLVL